MSFSPSCIVLEHGRTRLVIDALSGAVLRLEDILSKAVHIDHARHGEADQRLFRIVASTESWWSCYADAQDQSLVSHTLTDRHLVLHYSNLLAADGVQTDIAVQVDIQPSGEEDGFIFRMQLENHGDRPILDIAFPLLGGWLAESPSAELALGANQFIAAHTLEHSHGNNYARHGRRRGWYYPVGMSCPWVDLRDATGGISLINFMSEGRNGRFWADNQAGYGDAFRLMFGWSHLVDVQPGESWTSPPMALSVHDGDWRQTADRYTKWFDALHPPDYSRPHLRKRIGFQNYFIRGFDGTPVNSFESIPEAAAAGKKYGVDALCVWDTLTLGNYARYNPRDLTDYDPAERQALQKGLSQAEAEGAETMALINFRHPNADLHRLNNGLDSQIQRRCTGSFRTENFSANHTFGDVFTKHIGPESYVFSPFSPEHRERVLRLTRDYQDLGYLSMFYDQPFELYPDYGFHEQGWMSDQTHPEALRLVAEVKATLLAKHPQAIVIGEESDIHATPYVDQWMSWSIAEPSPELIRRVAMLRYSLPHTILSWVVNHQPERAALAFAMGMQLCLMVHGGEKSLAEVPDFAAYVRQLHALRQRTAERTVMARFRYHDSIEIDGDEGFHAFCYESPQGPAVIATAAGKAAGGKIKHHGEPSPSKPGLIQHLDGTAREHTGLEWDIRLEANDIVVWML